MDKVYPLIIRLALAGILAGVLFPSALSAYNINGSIVTLTASDRTSNNTSLIQGFLNNAAYTKIIIQPGTGNASWPVDPLFFNHNDTEIHLNANTVLEARTGGYPDGDDCVLNATGLSNIKLTGDADSKVLMHKEEYASMAVAEWRHALNLISCSNVTVSGLTLANTGGDGIYMGDTNGTGYCSNFTITNVVFDGCARNGLSVISVNGLTLSGCTFKNTKGLGNVATGGPWAGIDLEPNTSSEQLRNIVIDNCIFQNNNSYGLLLVGVKLDGSSLPLEVMIKNCTMQGNAQAGIAVTYVPASLNGNAEITFENCTISDNDNFGIICQSNGRDSGTLSFSNCYLRNNSFVGLNPAIVIYNYAGPEVAGNIQFNNIVVEQPLSQTINYFLCIDGTYGLIDNVAGAIYVSGGTLSTFNTANINVTTASNAAQARWKMDENSGSAADDSSGSCDGSLINSPAWAGGRIGGALTLNGTNQFMSVANATVLNIGTGDFSISLWMQRSDNSTNNKRLFYKGASSDSDIGYAWAGSNTELSMMISNGVTRLSTSCTIPSLNQWHHVAYTVNRASGKAAAYMDGVCQAQTDISSFSGGDISNTKTLLIGAIDSSGGLAWPGKIDDVRIYKRALTPGEIADFASGASAWWRFDDGSGSNALDSIGRYSGTLQNSPTWTTGKTGGALTLNGTNQFVTVTNDTSLNIGTGDFSVSLWMQRNDNSTNNKRLLCKGASSDSDIGYAWAGSNTELSMMISNGVTRLSTSCPIPSLNQWHHVAYTVDRASGKATAYVNGVYQAQIDISSFSGGDISNTKTLLIGAIDSSGGLGWPGKIDDMRIYKRVLSANEVVQLYSATP